MILSLFSQTLWLSKNQGIEERAGGEPSQGILTEKQWVETVIQHGLYLPWNRGEKNRLTNPFLFCNIYVWHRKYLLLPFCIWKYADENK